MNMENLVFEAGGHHAVAVKFQAFNQYGSGVRALAHIEGKDSETLDLNLIGDASYPVTEYLDGSRPTMSFSCAIAALKDRKRVARSGWNGKGMWLELVEPSRDGPDDVARGAFYRVMNGPIDSHECLPWIGMKTADDAFVPWLASQTDMLAEDWQIVPS